jgi:hypothetical protein
MTKAEIQAILEPRLRRSVRGWSLLVWVYLAFIAVTLVCEGMSLYAFRVNPVMLAALTVMVLLTLGFLAYGIYLLGELAAMDRADNSLVTALKRRLRFYRTKYEVWLWMLAVTIPFLSFAVSTMMDNQDGQYRINRPGVFIAVTAAQLVFMYVVLKIGHYPLMRQQQAILSDLESQVTTETDRVEAMKRTWRRWGLLLAILGTVLLVLGILRAAGWPG